MKIISYTALHYGKPYLAYALRSVVDYVDECWILYSAHGSHGSRTWLHCPDTRDELYAIARQAAGDKLRWIDGNWRQENEQRESIFQYAPDADVILVVDSDEVWRQDQLELLLDRAMNGSARNYLAREFPYWRSFYRAIPNNQMYPTRATNVHNPVGLFEQTTAWFNHFGYAQPTAYIEYKISCHGHKSEWRPEWFRERWLANAQVDCHPTNVNFWTPEDVDPWEYLPHEIMGDHPLAGLELIE